MIVTVLNTISQIGIVVLGALTIFLISRKQHHLRRWGYLTGICSEPFWFLAAVRWDSLYVNGVLSWPKMQWGIALLTIFYTWCWAVGMKNNWRKSEGD